MTTSFHRLGSVLSFIQSNDVMFNKKNDEQVFHLWVEVGDEVEGGEHQKHHEEQHFQLTGHHTGVRGKFSFLRGEDNSLTHEI